MALELNQLLEIGVVGALLISILASISPFLVTSRLKKLYGTANWKAVPALVESSTVEVSRVGGRAYYTPVIHYRYEVGGKTHVSTIISPDTRDAGSSDESWARKWTTILPMGTAITAYVDANRPDVAVLYPEIRNGWLFTWGLMLAAFGFFCVVLLTIYLAVRYVFLL